MISQTDPIPALVGPLLFGIALGSLLAALVWWIVG